VHDLTDALRDAASDTRIHSTELSLKERNHHPRITSGPVPLRRPDGHAFSTG